MGASGLRIMGVARFFSGGGVGGNTFSKNFSKNSQKILKKFSKNSNKIQIISKKILKKFKKILENFEKNFLKMDYFHERPGDFFGGGVRSTRGGLVRGDAVWGVPGAGAHGRRRSFQKVCKKSMKNLAIFLKFPRKFRDFFKIF